MPLREIEFELSSAQFQQMGYPRMEQGQPLTLILDGGILLPDPGADDWFAVQEAPLPGHFIQVGRARYAFTGRILEADIFKEAGEETALLLVDCDGVALRITCAPQAEGMLPFGTWETRTISGLLRLQGVVEDDFTSAIGKPVGVTLWGFRRLSLGPGDPFFGQWHESDELLSTPFHYDRVLINARLHREGI
jgi:hypothetical protein